MIKVLRNCMLMCLTGVTVFATAQTHFEKRMEVIRKDVAAIPADTTATIVMLGDSITEGFFNGSSMPAKIQGLPVINEGIGGDVIGTSVSKVGVMARLDEVKQAKPAIVFVMIGVNTMWDKDHPVDGAVREYEDMVPALKAAVPGARLILQSVLPTAGDRIYTNPKAATLNKRIQSLAKEHGAVWLDLQPLMSNEAGELKKEFTNDNVHLTPPAYAVWLEQIEKTVKEQVQ